MAFSWSVDGPLVKSVSPMTCSPSVTSTMTKLSDGHRSQTHRVGRIRFLRPLPLPVREVHEAFFAEDRQDLLHVDRAERLVGRERQFERRALHVVEQDVQIVGIDERMLGRGAEEEFRIAATNWSIGALEATSTAADRPDRRPARPARCQVAAIVPG